MAEKEIPVVQFHYGQGDDACLEKQIFVNIFLFLFIIFPHGFSVGISAY